MMKFVDAVGDRVGTEEYKDLEYQYQIKKGTMKMMKSKDIRIGLLLLMASMNSVAGSPIGAKGEDRQRLWMVGTSFLCRDWSLEHIELAGGSS